MVRASIFGAAAAALAVADDRCCYTGCGSNQLAATILVSGATPKQIVEDVVESGARILVQHLHQLQRQVLQVLLLRVSSSTVLIQRLISKRSESLVQVDRLNGVTAAGPSLVGSV
jgi:hypothetical protein